MNGFGLMSLLIALPAMAGLVLLLPLKGAAARWFGLAAALIELGLILSLWPAGQGAVPGVPGSFFLFGHIPWIRGLGIGWTLGMDAMSLHLVTLTGLLTLVAMLVSWRSVHTRPGLFFACLLILETALIGLFLSLDLFLFYVFWELMLIPMFFLIGVWGTGRTFYSATKFFLYTLAGSLLMLLAIIAVYLMHGSQTGVYTFALSDLMGTSMPLNVALWLYGAFLLAFAIKFPFVPLHTWLPDAYTDAPIAGSIILAGVMAKTGGYALIRFGYPLFPQAAAAMTPLLMALAVATILYASWIAFAQTDIKRLIAYSSMGHMGFVVLGIGAWTPVALSGAILQMVNHGITIAALFALAGFLEERTGTREIAAFGGLWGRIPVFAFLFLLFAMASAGLPGLNNFIGEFLILAGAFKVAKLATVLAFVGLIMPLVYMVRLVQAVLFQEPREGQQLHDLNGREILVLGVLAVISIYIGLHPAPLLEMIKTPVALLAGITGR